MRDEARDQASQALLTLADLTPSAATPATAKSVIPLEVFHWLPVSALAALHGDAASGTGGRPAPGTPERDAGDRLAGTGSRAQEPPPLGVPIARDVADRLAAIDQLRVGERSLRVGWLFVTGRRRTADGRMQRIFQPLVTRPVRIQRGGVGRPGRVVAAGDALLHEGVTDLDARAQLEAQLRPSAAALDLYDEVAPALVRTPSPDSELVRYAQALAEAAGFAVSGFGPAGAPPDELLRGDGLTVVLGMAIFAARPTEGTSSAASMAGWVADGLTDTWTAFHSLYVDVEQPPMPPPQRPEAEVATTGVKPVSPFPLTPAQRDAVLHSRDAPITVIAGAPGTGKSHTITAIACDALARGQTVLVGAKSEATIDALVALFEQAPGPRPVVFGSSERKDALAARLAQGQPRERADVEQAQERLQVAVEARDKVSGHIASQLRAEAALQADDTALVVARTSYPDLFDGTADLDEVGALIDVASHAGGGWLSLRRQRAATEELDDLSGARDDEHRRAFVAAFCRARDVRTASTLVASGGLELHGEWAALVELDAGVREAMARWLSASMQSAERFDRATLGAIGALSTALRSGRAVRRERLQHLDATITRALPLWVGTLADIEDLLPRVPGLFDVLVLDEASSIDQPLATPALLRARRAVVVGDPKQLRHVSFLSDDQRDRAFAANGVGVGSVLATKLDVRRNSAFDLAAANAPVLTLDEHFRCAPHLVDFVARRLYDGAVQVATRTPATQSQDCVEIVRVAGRRDADGVVVPEVDEVVRQARAALASGATSVGVITPFRAQADALEHAALGAFTADEIETIGLRIGTVHAFQGNERDLMIVSVGVGEEGVGGSWRFVQDPHLFTVLVTRARQRLVLVMAGEPPADGLLAAYVAAQDAPPGPPASRPRTEPWTVELLAALEEASLPVIAGYPTGRHVLDACVGDADDFFALEAAVHPDGAGAHIDRRMSLHRAGWTVREAFASRWGDRRGELVIELVEASRTASG